MEAEVAIPLLTDKSSNFGEGEHECPVSVLGM